MLRITLMSLTTRLTF